MTALVLVMALLMSIFPTAAYAETVHPTVLTCDTQTGMSTIYEYQQFDAGGAGTVYLNTYLATLHIRRGDLSLGGERLPVTIEFYYDAENRMGTDSTEVNPYGDGWATAYNQVVHFDAETNQFSYKNENGTWIYFADSGASTETGEKIWTEQTTYGIGATGAVLHLNADAAKTDYESIDVICNDIHHSFDSTGRLVSLKSGVNQVSIKYVPGSQHKIQQITDAVGRQYCFDYSSDSSGVLTRINCKAASGEAITSDNTAVSVTYSIEDGYLRSVTQSNGDSVSYTYDDNGRLTSIANVDACGFSFAYAGDTDAIASITAKAGMGTEQEESGSIVTVKKSSKKETEITDGDVRQNLTFDGCGRLTRCELKTREDEAYTCVYGFSMTYGYVTSEIGEVTNAVVDVEMFNADGVIEEPEKETEPTETVPEETEPTNAADPTDSYGNILSETYTEGTLHQTTTYTYSDDGNFLNSKTDENGNTQYYTYDSGTGLLEALIDGNGNQTTYTYNAMRELSAVHVDVSALTGSTGMDADYTYEKGRLTALNYGDYHYKFRYDIWGNVLSVTMNDAPLVSYDYGSHASKGAVDTMTYGNGQQVFYSYNALGQVSAVGYTDQPSRFQYTYDAAGELSEIWDSKTKQTMVYKDTGYQILSESGAVLYSYASDQENRYTETVNGATYQSTVKNQEDGNSTTKEIKDSGGKRILSASSAYDAFSRLWSKSIDLPGVDVRQNYSYAVDENGSTGSLVENYTAIYTGVLDYQTSLSFHYTYDGNGNITGITKTERSGNVGQINSDQPAVSTYAVGPTNGLIGGAKKDYSTTYAYDEAGQLIKAVDGETGKTYRYTYDSMGNILTMREASLLRNGQEFRPNIKTFQYTNGILSGYTDSFGTSVTYETDAMGNPTKITRQSGQIPAVTSTLSWGEGRMLTGIYDDERNHISYTYNADGLRTEKTVTKNGDETTTRYIWGDNGLIAAITGNQTVVVLYGSEGEAVGFSVDGTVYAYVKNLQGDVIRILDEDGDAVVSYTYDPWGVPTVTGDTELAKVNPCSYRGYYRDQETGYYYLQSRYYDPNIGRFLNVDDVALLNCNGTPLEGNLFNYCGNNAPNMNDASGFLGRHWWNSVGFIGGVIDAVLILIGVVSTNKTLSALKNLIRRHRKGITKRVWRRICRYFTKLTISWLSTAIDIALTLFGTSIGDLIAMALDYIDPWWGYRRSNGYILN